MKLYYEGLEIVEKGQEADFIRIDITDINDSERATALQSIIDHFGAVPYTLRLHYCRHDEGKSCEAAVL